MTEGGAMSVDLQRNRIALTMKSAATGDARPAADRGAPKPSRPRGNAGKLATPAAKPFTPRPGSIAPNGMRFR